MSAPRALLERVAAAIDAALVDPSPDLLRAVARDGAAAHAELLAGEITHRMADGAWPDEHAPERMSSGPSLELEAFGDVYAALAGHRVVRLDARAVRLRSPHARALWLPLAEFLAVPAAARPGYLHDLGLSRDAARRLVHELRDARDEPAVLAALTRDERPQLAHPGDLVLQPCRERRRAGAHYTPRALADAVVRAALRPVLAALGPAPTAEELLRLKVCDPAMGSGVFLLAAVRQLAEHLVAAWSRGHVPENIPPWAQLRHARRLVAERCVFGVDADPHAVALARRSLWLLFGTDAPPPEFLRDHLRHGDALLGLDLAHLRAFHWRDGPSHPDLAAAVDRDPILARHLGDQLLGAFLQHPNERTREAERRRRLERVCADLARGVPSADFAARDPFPLAPPFHWPLAFPFAFDVFVGNPPFLGGSQISGAFGDAYLAWLRQLHPGAHGNADLCAHFLRRADSLLAESGTIGLIATNTIGQGDTRTTGLQPLLARGYLLHQATRDLPWPETAAVTVAIVHLARGAAATAAGPPMLHEPCLSEHVSRVVPAISSHLRAGRERPDPVPLAENARIAFAGSKIYGQGFLLDADERAALIAADPRNAGLIFPYLGGDDIHHARGPRRFVINFGRRGLAEAEAFPALIARVRERVKPERDRNGRALRREHWWRFGELAPGLYAALRGLERCVVNSQVCKHLVFDLAPTHYVYSHTTYVHATPAAFTLFAVLQSRIHAIWAWRLASSMKTDLRYSIADCFNTFPFPHPGPRVEHPVLGPLGRQLHTERTALLTSTLTLTGLYNALADRHTRDPAIAALRARHHELDRAVLAAYDWHDLEPPPDNDENFSDAVFARLLAANAARAA